MLHPFVRRAIVGLAVLGLALATTAPASAGSPVAHERDGGHKDVTVHYFPDDICGPRASWVTVTVTWRLRITDLGDSWHLVYGETGTYTADYVDPATPDYKSQFTNAVHINLTRGGTYVYTDQWHDFPSPIVIRSHIVFVEVDGEVRVDRFVDDVSGCP
jgi:hypothetical protein